MKKELTTHGVSRNAWWVFGLLCFVVGCVAHAVCGSHRIEDSTLHRGQLDCRENREIAWIDVGMYTVTTGCRNGARFTREHLAPREGVRIMQEAMDRPPPPPKEELPTP